MSGLSLNIAAIDIGSNAIRLVIGAVEKPARLRMLKKFREPVRLGHDVFLDGEISEKTEEKALRAFGKFKEVMKKYEVRSCKAVATSACREAKNKDAFVKRVYAETGIKINIIDGIEEARLVHLAVQKEVDLSKKRAILIDIGGGSVEVTFSEDGYLTATESFRMGTVRLLENLQKRKLKEEHLNILIGEFVEKLSKYLDSNSGEKLAFAVGTGGNIECLGRLKVQLLGKSPNTFVTSTELAAINDKLRSISVEDRITNLEMRPDRADVIVPASMVLQMILRQAGVDKLLVPYVGLKDGILWSTVQG
ncbi:MAG: hypothetical protein AB7O96_11820 [Pseudobdellovibrionaceae bacterium]